MMESGQLHAPTALPPGKELMISIKYEAVLVPESPSIIRVIKSRRMRWASHVARMREKKNAYRLLVVKPEGKKPLGRPRRRWVDNIRMDLGKIGWGDVDWIGLAQDRNKWRALVNSVLSFRVP
jgi:hypothetical protein